MPTLLILRLHPEKPMDGNAFRALLNDLTIKAFDLSYGDSKTGHHLGTASGLAHHHIPDINNHFVDINATSIIQHYRDVLQPVLPPEVIRVLEAAATAVIVVDTPAGYPEYPAQDSFDIRLEITRGGLSIGHRALHYNVRVAGVLANDQRVYFGLGESAFIALPAANVGLAPGLAHVDVPSDGQPPQFSQLLAAINLVLKKDPGNNAELIALPPLTVAQSRQIAAEIVWNRVMYPPPAPPRPLGELYTLPPLVPGADKDALERDRKLFEGELAAYQAIHEAEALRLAGFVYAVSAAVRCERLSVQANRAGLEFPILTGAPGEEAGQARVILEQAAPLDPSFVVAAAFFYALGAMLPMVISPEQRYDMARFQQEARNVDELQTRADAGVIAELAAPLTVHPAPPAIQLRQAARRLSSLGATKGAATDVTLEATIIPLVASWLAHAGPTDTIVPDFWVPAANAQPVAYLELLLKVISDDHTPLIDALKAAPFNIDSVQKLVALTDEQWRTLLVENVALLPPFTAPGTAEERAEAFIRHLRKFFAVPVNPVVGGAGAASEPPLFGMAHGDVLEDFMSAYSLHAGGGAAFAFGGSLNNAAMAAIGDVFPEDAEARAWLEQLLQTINALFDWTSGVSAPELQFSLIEALFARGFTSPADVQGLTSDEFQDALIGTVAYARATVLYKQSGASPPSPEYVHGFRPVNPDGTLTNCVPPEHLSPLGPVAYLAEMLRVTAASTCQDPFHDPNPEEPTNLGVVLADRRGPLGALHATHANLTTPLPVIDLVNECLEALVAGKKGAVHDTAGDVLGGHALRGPTAPVGGPYLHDPQTLFAALPEHSSPATPVKEPGAYAELAVDFTAPALPYPQALDINRSYLRALGSSRFLTMRTFREEITEFALDPAHEPADFQRHLWRYPVRFPIALEYLEISQPEYELLYAQDIATSPMEGTLLLWEVYGFASEEVGQRPWTDVVVIVPEFLRRTGLSYCEFLELWRSGFVEFVRGDGESREFPECLPCCPDSLVLAFTNADDVLTELRKLAVFIRLWRRLQQLRGPKLTFSQLRDTCDVLGLFDAADAINPGFLRELAALLMLRDWLRLPLFDSGATPAAGETGAARTHLLALWVGPAATRWSWALATLLERIDADAEAQNPSLRRAPELTKLLENNLDPLSRLAGFDPLIPSDTWHARPTATLRFAEVLAKLYASEFTVGQLLFLFTPEAHAAGDDPFRVSDANEALEDPFDLPEDLELYQLWALRGKLLAVDVDDVELESWTWARIVHALREELGFVASLPPDPLDAFGEHFFPSVLEAAGHPVAVAARQFRVPLPAADTSPLMWNTPPGGPFQYDTAAEQLWAQLPVRDDAVVEALQAMRPLKSVEQDAVRDLYFSPRLLLAQLAFVFENFSEAVHRLTHEAEAARWSYFRRQFARFYRRCRQIAQHLAEHVAAETGRALTEGDTLSWKLLRHLLADENFATSDWEHDLGAPPGVTYGPQPHGGAFAALLGLTGTGLLAEFRVKDAPVWREVGGALSVFGAPRNEWNAPVPVIVPSMGFKLTDDQLRFVVVRNGFALRDVDGTPLGGAEPFAVRWSGVLMIESSGPYRFHAGAPTPEGQEPDFQAAREHRWRLVLKRGQKRWILLNHRWAGENAPDARSGVVSLRRGAYEIEVELEQEQPNFGAAEDICRRRAGFEIKYTGPDSDERLVAIPLDKLFRDLKTGPLSVDLEPGGVAQKYLESYYGSSLRDIRRTYQRAFKALLFAHRFALSARPIPGDRQSEIGYMLAHPAAFLGTSYPRTGPAAFGVHRAHFDFNLLPVSDPYHPPSAAQDGRHAPSPRRQSALFDWWERVRDLVVMRAETRAARERPAWLLFYEASEQQPDDPPQLVRHLGVDIRHAPLVLEYFATPDFHKITTPELEDERWALRVWQGEKWIRALKQRFFPAQIGEARPALWASDDPGAPGGAPPGVGNEDLTRFVRNGSFENGAPRRYDDVTALNDGLRLRARAALLAYLCGMNRVPLPWGETATTPRDLSDLLLQDVEVGTCQRASRIEEAISAVQKFVQRARLGLEPHFVVTPALALLWDRQFAAFRVWERCERRWVYRENWIAWDEIEKARRTEAFRFLQDELRRATLTVPVPGGLSYWPGERPPPYPGLTLLQSREPAGIQRLAPSAEPEGLDLRGTPERHARPAWLAPIFRDRPRPARGREDREDERTLAVGEREVTERVLLHAAPIHDTFERLPLWVQAAIRLGTRFVRVAAAGVPPATAGFTPRRPAVAGECCVDCGRVHPPLVDEYYFWLQDARLFSTEGQDQNADQGVTPPEMVSDWHDPDKLPTLLHWESRSMVHLFWCRYHNGEFMQPRRSDAGVPIRPTFQGVPQLDFKGRTGDSLRFEITGALATPPQDPPLDPTPPGFRYDIVTDSAVVLPLVVAPPVPQPPLPGGLSVYPYFAYFAPGAPLLPLSRFSEAVTVAGTLRTRCRFEAALKWYGLMYDPLRRDSTWAQCPAEEEQPPGDGEQPIIPRAGRRRPVRGDRAGDVACCPSTATSDDVARNRAVLLEYLETLLQWGDALMCRNTPEAFQQAAVVFDTMRRILGQHPPTISARDDQEPMTLAEFQPRPAPLNPRLLSLYERSDDRFALIHHCNNGRRLRNGRPNVDMPYFGNSELRDGWQAAGSVCADDGDWCISCCSAYRFSFLVQKALELAGEVRAFGAALLAAYEKGDAEYLASLRATHERQLLTLALDVRKHQWREADWQVQALQKTKEGAQTRYRYYQNLIANGLNGGEVGYQALIALSLSSRIAGNVLEGVAQGQAFTMDMWYGMAGIMGSPLQFNQIPIGSKLAGSSVTGARILTALSENASTAASLSLTEGGWARREEEWIHQVEVIGIEIEQIERQILAAERRRDIALHELNNHQRQIENAREVQDFLRDKFTSHELYLFLQQETAALMRQSYELALQTARQAQRAFNYERGHTMLDFLAGTAWENLHESVQIGDKLVAAVRQMDKAYLDHNCREYELTKHVSLRLHFPAAFLRLRATGYCEIDIPEWMFDLDYPGHFMRRIRNVSVTIPCVAGPYTGVHCRITMLSSRTRVDPRLLDPPARCCDDRGCSDGYQALEDDARVRRTYAATEAIATSSGQNDTGLFELNFRDERYLPFEFAGAISRWRIELPQENNQWSLDTLGDFVLHLNYTAREGGDVLRRAANELAQRHLPGAGVQFIDVRHELPDAWHAFQTPEREPSRRDLVVRLTREMFPFLSGRRRVKVERLELLFEAPGAVPSANGVVELLFGHHPRTGGDECGGDRRFIHCVASSEWPELYHGSVEFDPRSVADDRGRAFATLRFPHLKGDIGRVFLLVGYRAE